MNLSRTLISAAVAGGLNFKATGCAAHKMVVPMEVKEVSEDGKFSGYASIFGNVDLGGDVISKDAPFKEFVKTDDGKVLTLFQHDSFGMTPSGGLPIGLAEVEQNAKGLKFETELVMDDPFVQRVHKHLKKGTLKGMSIGFDILPGGARMLESGVRELTAMKLWEISVVTFGMNPKAGVNSVKSGGIITLRDFEDFLHDALWDAMVKGRRVSRDDVKLLASRGFKAFESTRDASGPEEAEKRASELRVSFLESISAK